jgi:hypothetical protein
MASLDDVWNCATDANPSAGLWTTLASALTPKRHIEGFTPAGKSPKLFDWCWRELLPSRHEILHGMALCPATNEFCQPLKEQPLPRRLQDPEHFAVKGLKFVGHSRQNEMKANVQLLGRRTDTGSSMRTVATITSHV